MPEALEIPVDAGAVQPNEKEEPPPGGASTREEDREPIELPTLDEPPYEFIPWERCGKDRVGERCGVGQGRGGQTAEP